MLEQKIRQWIHIYGLPQESSRKCARDARVLIGKQAKKLSIIQNPQKVTRSLNDGKLFCLLSDQDSRIPSALSGTLLGQPVNVNPLPDFLLKHRPQTPVFICWMEERGASPKDASSKKVRVFHAIEVGGAQSKVVEKFNKWLEERIRENPNLWYSFTHRRFYSQTPEIYGE